MTDADSNDYTETFNIVVNNVDEAPTDLALSNSSVEENDAGAVIGDLTVTDPEQTTGFTYTLSDDRFEVVNGQLKLKDGVALDYEQETQVSIDITVTDADSNDYTETFNIVVNNVDEAPTDLALSNSSVEENDAGAVIGDLTVTDPEQTTGFTYTLSDDRFEVVNGQLKLKDGVALDYEQETQVSIDITVTDVDSNDYTETFNIVVNNVDEAPTDLALSNSSVEENDAGAVIGDLTVTDPEQTTGFTYTLSDDRFEVVNGQLKLKDGVALDYEQESQVSIDITVTDVDSNDYTETFNIVVNNVDEAPTDLALSNSSVEENDAGAVIGDLTVTDPEQTTGFTYTLSDDRFEVVNGQLKLKDGVALDYEQETQVSIDITVTDVDSNDYTETFNIVVNNVDEAPTDLALSNSSVEENDAGAVIGNLTVTDPDQTTGFTYTLSDDRFEVVSGQLKLKDGVALDYEQETQVSIDITVTDVDSNDYTETFVIDVNDVAENVPPTAVSLTNVRFVLPEDFDTGSGVKIADIVVTDDNLGTNTLSLSGADADAFEIIDTELYLKAGTALDFSTKEQFDVRVEVDDTTVGLTPDATTDFSLYITEAAGNAAPTAVSLTNVRLSLAENSDTSNRVHVADIVVTDDNLGTNNLSLSGADADLFEIDGMELYLKADTLLDFEARTQFLVTVEVDDPDVGPTPDATTI